VAVRRFPRAAILCALALFSSLGVGIGEAQESDSITGIKARMSAIQEELDAATLRIENLRTQQDRLYLRRAMADLEITRIEREQEALAIRVQIIAREMYMGGDEATLEALLTSEDMGELAARLEYVSAVGESNERLFIEQRSAAQDLIKKRDELEAQVGELIRVEGTLASETAKLQTLFAQARDEYKALQKKLEAEAAARLAELGELATPKLGAGGLVCPIDGPNSFIDSWGFPRSGGRSHEGTDMMAAFGTPVVAIADGTITYVGVGETAGNWIRLTSNEGDAYWYMHNKENLASVGKVRAGELIATVGDTGNAIGGPPHVHFEYHPGDGGPVNPYPLLSGIC
jgi:murein DD-endopeptidase MepM/ murein hydrolase activator NlpD